MEPITIRAGEPADHPAMNQLWQQATTARRAGIGLSEPEALDAARTLNDPDIFTIVAVTGGRIIGMALGRHARDAEGLGAPVPRLCHISMVAVAPEQWGQGIGRRLMTDLLERIRARGYTRAQLWTQGSNTRACTLYEHLGFTLTGRQKRDDAGEPILHFERAMETSATRPGAPG